MPAVNLRRCLTWVLLLQLPLLAPGLAAQEATSLQTDWMQMVKGQKDTASGAEVIDVDDTEAAGTRKVTLSIPKDSMGEPGDIEEVLVVGQAPEKSEPLDITWEWVDDPDEENYGLVIRLSRNTNWPIRLYMNSAPGFTR